MFTAIRTISNGMKNHRNPLALPYHELEAVLQKGPVQVPQFERLIAQIDTHVRSAYQAAKLNTEDRLALEREMLTKATIPSILIGVARDLLTTDLSVLKSEINVAELYFTDTSILGLSNDEHGKRWRNEHPIDAMRNTPLPPRDKEGVRLKRCTKCGNVMQDIQPNKNSDRVIYQLQRHCLCGSWWMQIEDEGQ